MIISLETKVNHFLAWYCKCPHYALWTTEMWMRNHQWDEELPSSCYTLQRDQVRLTNLRNATACQKKETQNDRITRKRKTIVLAQEYVSQIHRAWVHSPNGLPWVSFQTIWASVSPPVKWRQSEHCSSFGMHLTANPHHNIGEVCTTQLKVQKV